MHTWLCNLHIPIMKGGDEKKPHEMNGFQPFFEKWLIEQGQHLEELNIASKQNGANDQVLLSSLVDRVVKHYEHYYKAKSSWAKQDVLRMLSPSWRSSLEDAFLWIGGWRPSMAFHLLYSKSGIQLEASFDELMRGMRLSVDDLGELTQGQLAMVDKLQRRTIQEEKHVSEKMAKMQESVADATLVELAHEASENLRRDNENESEGMHENGGEEDEHMERVENSLACKEEGLERILHKADELRMRTLKNIIQILSPLQGVHFLIAAAELHLRVHEWGKRKDEASCN